MRPEDVVEIIQLVIAPTVMISGCTMIQNGILTRYGNLGSRIRSLSRERAELLEIDDLPELLSAEALCLLDSQLISLSQRHQTLQKASLILYGAILFFLLSVLAISLAKIIGWGQLSMTALLLFLLGNGNLLIGVILAGIEVHVSHQAIRSEVQWVMTLAKPTVQDTSMSNQSQT